jgi:hypothetical protein
LTSPALETGAYFTNSSAGKSYVVFGKADSSAIDLSVIADAYYKELTIF